MTCLSLLEAAETVPVILGSFRGGQGAAGPTASFALRNPVTFPDVPSLEVGSGSFIKLRLGGIFTLFSSMHAAETERTGACMIGCALKSP